MALPVLLFIVFGVLIVVMGIYSYQQQQRRLSALITMAQELGWQFSAEYDYSHDRYFTQFEVFRRGESRYAYNTMRGSITTGGRACPAQMGDFHYKQTSGTGKDRREHTYRFSYLIVELPYGVTPNLMIRPQGVFDSLASAFGFPDINFESAQFNKRFHVSSANRRFAYDVLHPRMIEFLMTSGKPIIDIECGQCCITDSHQLWSASQFSDCVAWTGRFFELWPKHVVTSLKSD